MCVVVEVPCVPLQCVCCCCSALLALQCVCCCCSALLALQCVCCCCSALLALQGDVDQAVEAYETALSTLKSTAHIRTVWLAYVCLLDIHILVKVSVEFKHSAEFTKF